MSLSYLDIPKDVQELLFQFGIKKVYKTHEVLTRVGEQCNSIYYVIKGGFLRKFYNDQSEILRTISFHLPTHRPFVTVNESYFAQKPSNYEIKAFRSSEVLIFQKDLILQMNQKHSFLQEFYSTQIIEALIYENEFKSRLLTYSSKEFYNYLGEEYPEIIKNVPSKYIAEIMRISPEWLSKLKSKSE